MTVKLTAERIRLAAIAHNAELEVSRSADRLLDRHLLEGKAAASSANLWLGDGHARADADPALAALRLAVVHLEAARLAIMSIQTEE